MNFKEWLANEAFRYWDGKMGEYVSANVVILWEDEFGGKPAMKGKVGGSNWDQFLVNAHQGHGKAYFIDARNKADALAALPQVQPHPKYQNVFYFGKAAKIAVRA